MIGIKYGSNFHSFVNQQNVNDGGRLGSYPKKKGGIGESMNVSYITKLIDHIVQNQDME